MTRFKWKIFKPSEYSPVVIYFSSLKSKLLDWNEISNTDSDTK